MSSSATSAGVALSYTCVRTARVPRDRTLATSATTAGKLALLLSRPVARSSGRYDVGFYELSGSAAAPQVHFYHPSLGKITVPPPPTGTTSDSSKRSVSPLTSIRSAFSGAPLACFVTPACLPTRSAGDSGNGGRSYNGMDAIRR